VCIILTSISHVREASEGNTPIATIGDAIASFLSTEDPTTRGMCLAGKPLPSEAQNPLEFIKRIAAKSSRHQTRRSTHGTSWPQQGMQASRDHHARWFDGASQRWYSTIIL
jgi:hypothetical protein